MIERNEEPGPPALSDALGLSIGPHPDRRITLLAIDIPDERTMLIPLHRLRHCDLNQPADNAIGGTSDDKVTRAVLG